MGGPRLAPLRRLEEPTVAAYLAALIDGEGTIGIFKTMGQRSLSPSYYVQVTVVNTNTTLMRWLVDEIGGSSEPRKDSKSRDPRHKQAHHWRVHGLNVDALLEAIRPYLICKRKQADLALQLRALYRQGSVLTPADLSAREALKQQMHVLNKRGNPDYTTERKPS